MSFKRLEYLDNTVNTKQLNFILKRNKANFNI